MEMLHQGWISSNINMRNLYLAIPAMLKANGSHVLSGQYLAYASDDKDKGRVIQCTATIFSD